MEFIPTIEERFSELMNTLYTVQCDSYSVNVINYLAWIMRAYIQQEPTLTKFTNNICTIIVGGAPADVSHAVIYNEIPHIKDVDMATNLTAQQIVNAVEWFRQQPVKSIPFPVNIYLLDKLNSKSISNGTVNIYIDHPDIVSNMRHIEMTTFRKESGQRGEHQSDAIGIEMPTADALECDRARRDLTIGTVYTTVNPYILDKYDGIFFEHLIKNTMSDTVMQHVKNGIVAFMGNPYERIWEDGIRLLRLIRKAAKENHQMLDEHLYVALTLAPGLHSSIEIAELEGCFTKPVSMERILHPQDGEVIKLFRSPGVFRVLNSLYIAAEKINCIANVESLFLPQNPNLDRLNNDEWLKNNDILSRYASLYLSHNGQLMNGADSVLRKLVAVDSSVMGDNKDHILILIALIIHVTKTHINFTSKKEVYEMARDIQDIIYEFYKIHSDKKIKIKLKMTTGKAVIYLKPLANFLQLSINEVECLNKYYNMFIVETTHIKKMVYTDQTIGASIRKSICDQRLSAIFDIL